MKTKYLLVGMLMMVVSLTSCRFTFEESDYVGHYEGTYRLANFFPNEGDAVMDITSCGNKRCNIMFWSQGSDSIFLYNWPVVRVSDGLYGGMAHLSEPTNQSDIYVTAYDHSVFAYLDNTMVYVDFTGHRVN